MTSFSISIGASATRPFRIERSISRGLDEGVVEAYREELCCTACQEIYNEEDNPPLTTYCGHTFCRPCIRECLTESRKLGQLPTCFSCKANLGILSASDLPVNQTIVKLAGYLSFSMLYPDTPKEVPAENKEIVTLMPTAQVVARDNVGECKRHIYPIISRCSNCNLWMCSVCVRNHLMASDEGKCDIVPAFKAMRIIKETEAKDTGLTIDKLNFLKGDLLARIALLNEQKRKSQIAIATLKEELLQIEVNIRGVEDKKITTEEKISEVQSWIETLLESRSRTFLAETVEGVESSQEETNRYLKEAAIWIDCEENVNGPEDADTNFTIPRVSGPVGLEYIKQRVLLSQQLYTIDHTEGGKTRWGKLEICGQDIILHAHSTKPPPKGATMVPYKELTDAMPSLPGAFFDISWDNLSQGRVFFQFFSVNPRSLQHLLLSMGDWGPCYRDTVLMPNGISYLLSVTEHSSSSTSILYGGNYSPKPMEGCRALYDNIKDGGEYVKPIVPGLLAGMPSTDEKYMAMFKIYLDIKEGGGHCSTAFGQVKSGLPILQAAAKKIHETNVVIENCGLVFPIW